MTFLHKKHESLVSYLSFYQQYSIISSFIHSILPSIATKQGNRDGEISLIQAKEWRI